MEAYNKCKHARKIACAELCDSANGGECAACPSREPAIV